MDLWIFLNNVNSAEQGSEVLNNKMEAPSIDTCKEEHLSRSSLQNKWHLHSHCVEAEWMIWQKTTAYSSEDPSLGFGIFHFQVKMSLFKYKKPQQVHTVAKNKFCNTANSAIC